MPVTITPTPQKVGVNRDLTVKTSQALLSASSRAWTIDPKLKERDGISTNKKCGEEDRKVLQSSLAEELGGSTIIPYGNGFVDGIIRAFNQDLHLVLRPDDVWLAILTQFSMYINGNAEEMRSFFVEHDGKRQLVLDARPSPLGSIDMAAVASGMTHLIEQNIIDDGLRAWMMPDFTTTTNLDSAVAGFVMMGSLQHYFEYIVMWGCGFPSVTLLGEKSDWDALVDRAKILPKYGKETAEWSRLLLPVLRAMANTFDEPDSARTRDFWLRPCYEAGVNGSIGFATLSGWITAFCFWTEDGKRAREIVVEGTDRSGMSLADRKPLTLDGVTYPLLSPNAIPKAFVTVPIIMEDYESMQKVNTTVVAGHVGMELTRDGSQVQPVASWWMLEDSREPLRPAKETE